jgi:hypothetical protein
MGGLSIGRMVINILPASGFETKINPNINPGKFTNNTID